MKINNLFNREAIFCFLDFFIVHLTVHTAANLHHSQRRQMKINHSQLTRFLTIHFFRYFGSMHHHRLERLVRRDCAREAKRAEYLGYKARTEDRELPQNSLSFPFSLLSLSLYLYTYISIYCCRTRETSRALEFGQRRDSSPSRLRLNWISSRSINGRMEINSRCSRYCAIAILASASPGIQFHFQLKSIIARQISFAL